MIISTLVFTHRCIRCTQCELQYHRHPPPQIRPYYTRDDLHTILPLSSTSLFGYLFPSDGGHHTGVSKNRGTQNGWFIMEKPIKMGWFGGTIIFGNTHTLQIPIDVTSTQLPTACGYSQRRRAKRMANSPLGPSKNTASKLAKVRAFRARLIGFSGMRLTCIMKMQVI